MIPRLRTLASVLACHAAVSGAVHAQTYRAINLGQLASLNEYFYATALNNSNQVVGYTVPGMASVRAVLWQNGTVTDLGSLTGNDGAGAFAINDAGEIVGTSPSASGPNVAVSWTNGTITSLGTLPGSGSGATSIALAINSTGQIAGTSTPPVRTGGPHNKSVFLYSSGVMSSLDPSNPLDTSATAIDDNGDVAGYLATSSQPAQAMLWSGGVATMLPFVSPADSTTSTLANAMNNQHQIAGTEFTPTVGTTAVIWSVAGGAPTATALGSGQAFGINNAGQIVGSGGTGHATLWPTVGATGLDLNDLLDPATPLIPPGVPVSQTVLTQANAINDNGAIIAIASSDGGITIESVLLVPETLSLSVTPAALSFAPQSTGTTSTAQTVTVDNTGATAFNFGSIKVNGDYAQTNNCGASLPAGSQCTISVKFTPTAPGSRTGILTAVSGGTSYSANLTGTGNINTVNATRSSGGGGALDKWSLLFLVLGFGLPYLRQRACGGAHITGDGGLPGGRRPPNCRWTAPSCARFGGPLLPSQPNTFDH